MARIYEHKSAIGRYDTNSQIQKKFEAGHVVDFEEAMAQAMPNGSRLVQGEWLSGPNALNRSIELHSSFLALRHKLQQEHKRRILPGAAATTTTSKKHSPAQQENPTTLTHAPVGDNKGKDTHYHDPGTELAGHDGDLQDEFV